MRIRSHATPRKAAALVEAAIVLPVLLVLIGITIDYSRVFYLSTTLSGSARNGAIYEFDPLNAGESDYTSATQAALQDATNIRSAVSVSKSSTVVNGFTRVRIEVASDFKTMAKWGILPSSTHVNRSITIQQAPLIPDEPVSR